MNAAGRITRATTGDAADKAVTLAHALGLVSTCCFLVQYLPQIVKNHQRKSVEGFSPASIVIKLIGAAFLLVNSAITGEPTPVVLYGLSNIAAHSVFMFQFSHFLRDRTYLLWVAFPAIPATLAALFPDSVHLTSSVKPITQLVSHWPQLVECVRCRTTRGCSLLTQHMNFVGGACGLLMCTMVEVKSRWTWLIYANSLFQAVSIYLLAFWYDWRKSSTTPSTSIPPNCQWSSRIFFFLNSPATFHFSN